MTESDITVLDMSSGENVRTIARNIGGTNKHMQVVTPYCGVIGSWLTLFAQKYSAHSPEDSIIYGTKFTLPGGLTAKWHAGAANAQADQLYILRRRPLPTTIYAPGTGAIGKTTSYTQSNTDNSTILDGIRFFLVEPFLDSLTLSKMVQFKANIGVRSENASATAYLQNVIFTLRKLTGNDTYTDIASVTLDTNIQNKTTTEVVYSFIADALISSPVTVSPGEVLVFEVSTKGMTSNTSYKAYNALWHGPGSSESFIEILVEDI